MNLPLFMTVFATVFLAELGDKTQLATVLFSGKHGGSLMLVFTAASLALITATAIAVAAGAFLSQVLDPRYLSFIAGTGFVFIGIWTIWQAS